MSLLHLTESQNKLYQFIESFIKTKKSSPTINEIASNLALKSRGAIHRNLKSLAKQNLITLLPNRRRNIRLNSAQEKNLLPLVGRIAAGRPIEAIAEADQPYLNINEMLEGKDRFFLEVKGDSMSGDNICDGDLVICEKTSMVHRDQIAVVLVNGTEATLKRVMREGDKILLIPSNPHASTMEYAASAVQIQGVYLGLMRLKNLLPYKRFL